MSFGFSVEGKVKSGKPTTFPSPCQRPPSLPDLSHWTVPNNFFEEIALQGAVFYENQIPIYPYPSIQAKNEERPPPLPPETLLATALSSEISRPSQSQVPLTIAEQQPTRAGHPDIQILEGCNGTYNHLSSVATNNAYSSEREADPTYFPSEHERETYLFNPVSARHVESDWSYSDSVIRVLHAGEEMLTNYLQFVVQKRDWAETVRSLNALCKGEEVGLVVKAGETNTDAAEKLKKFI